MGQTDESPHRRVARGTHGGMPPPPLSSFFTGRAPKRVGAKKRKGEKRGEKGERVQRRRKKLDSAPPLTKKKKKRFLRPTYKEEKQI